MEVLIGALISLVSQGIKRLEGTIGGNATLVLVFILCYIGTAVYQAVAATHGEFLQGLATTYLSAVGFYEVILKRIPIVGKAE